MTVNPAADRALRRQLHQQVDALAATVTLKPDGALGASAGNDARRAVAAAWVYTCCVVVWAEDHDLVRPLLRRSPTGLVRTPASGTLWLGRAFEQLATGGVHVFQPCAIPPTAACPTIAGHAAVAVWVSAADRVPRR
jgi:hypothetical protein